MYITTYVSSIINDKNLCKINFKGKHLSKIFIDYINSKFDNLDNYKNYSDTIEYKLLLNQEMYLFHAEDKINREIESLISKETTILIIMLYEKFLYNDENYSKDNIINYINNLNKFYMININNIDKIDEKEIRECNDSIIISNNEIIIYIIKNILFKEIDNSKEINDNNISSIIELIKSSNYLGNTLHLIKKFFLEMVNIGDISLKKVNSHEIDPIMKQIIYMEGTIKDNYESLELSIPMEINEYYYLVSSFQDTIMNIRNKYLKISKDNTNLTLCFYREYFDHLLKVNEFLEKNIVENKKKQSIYEYKIEEQIDEITKIYNSIVQKYKIYSYINIICK